MAKGRKIINVQKKILDYKVLKKIIPQQEKLVFKLAKQLEKEKNILMDMRYEFGGLLDYLPEGMASKQDWAIGA